MKEFNEIRNVQRKVFLQVNKYFLLYSKSIFIAINCTESLEINLVFEYPKIYF